jgi:alpha-mannosidase
MKPIPVRIALTIAIIVGATIMFLVITRQFWSPGKARESLGNFDSETHSLISRADRVVFLIPFSHWDTDWHQGFEAYSKLSDNNIQSAIDLAKQDARFRFTLEQVLFAQHFWETNPASRTDLMRLVQNKQLTFAWGGITQPETSLVAPAIQVHNLELGQQWIAETFGAEYVPHTAWQSDAFGNSAAFPAFLNQFNIPYLFIGRHQGRCDPDYQTCRPLPPVFYWKSPADTGRVLVTYGSYYLAYNDIQRNTDPEAQLAALSRTIEEEFKQTNSNYLFLPVGFDFSSPQANLMSLVDHWNASNHATVLVVSDPSSAFQYLATQQLPEITVDMNPIWQAFYNTRPAAKIADKESEYYLTAADKFGLLLNAPPSSVWNLAAFNAHYDNISGVSFDTVWENSQSPRFEQTIATAKQDLAEILADISGRVPASITIFNPTSWTRSEVIELHGDLLDLDSLPAPMQQIDSNTVAFYVKDVPSLGYIGLNGGQTSIEHPVSVAQAENQITLSNGPASVTLDGDHGGTFSSLKLLGDTNETELLTSFGDDVTYWNDSGDVYGAFFESVNARESNVTAQMDVIASGPLLARVRAVFELGGQKIVKTVTLRANDPLIEVELDISALSEATAITQTPTILDTNLRTDDLGFGAFTHIIDTKPIAPGDRTYRRSIFYPITYWSDVSNKNIGLALITHGLQGVSGGDMRGLMLVRQVTKDPEGITDPGVHHLRYAYLPHRGTAADAQIWKAAYEFNQPMIVTWKNGQTLDVQIPFNDDYVQEFRNPAQSPALPVTSSLLSAQDVVIADLYWKDDQIEALVLNYESTKTTTLQLNGQRVSLPASPLTLMPLPPSALGVPIQK